MDTLLRNLLSLTDRHEDFFTEWFAAALRSDGGLLRDYCSQVLGVEVKDEDVPHIAIATQVRCANGTRAVRPDLVITLRNGDRCAVEHKLLATLGSHQLEDYLDLGFKVALVTARTGHSIEGHVLDHANYLKPDERDHFVWPEIYALVARAASAPDAPLEVKALQKLFEIKLLDPAPATGDLLPSAEWEKERRTEHYATFWKPTEDLLASQGWDGFVIHPWPEQAQLYVNSSPVSQVSGMLLEVVARQPGVAVVRSTIYFADVQNLETIAAAVETEVSATMPRAQVLVKMVSQDKARLIVNTPLQPFVEGLEPAVIHERLARHFSRVAEMVSRVEIAV
jgi:hypothetical protein